MTDVRLSGGVNLLEEIRELATEVLLLGWGRILLLEVPKIYGTFIRNQMGNGTLEVQVDSEGVNGCIQTR